MSQILEKLTEYVPKFTGSCQEARRNYGSHKWHTVHLCDVFHEVRDPSIKVIECSTCGVLANHEVASYSCGAAPATSSLAELLAREKGPTSV